MKYRLLAFITVLLILLSSCGAANQGAAGNIDFTIIGSDGTRISNTGKDGNDTDVSDKMPEDSKDGKKENKDNREGKVSFLGVGDNIIYFGTYRDAQSQSDGSRAYNFAPIYRNVKEMVSSADIAFINQETPVSENNEPESYPTFNSPVDLTYDVKDAGFDIINLANNHMLDQGADGLKDSYNNWKARDLTVIGCYEEQDERYITYLEKNNVKLAFVSYTYGTNLSPDPATVGLYAPYLKQSDFEGDIKEAKDNADFVIVSVHWGDEGALQPNESQKAYAEKMAKAGADVIIGHHPHVLEPIEWIDTDGGRCLCVYSLGNFVHEQDHDYNVPGGILTFDIVKGGGETKLENPMLTPTVCHYPANFYNNVVYFFSDYTPELASQHAVATYYNNSISYDSLKNVIVGTISSEFLPDYLK